MIIYLINSVMNNVDTCKEFVIHVSPDDYRFAINNQNLITGALSKEVHIEISEDSTLSRNECLIETDSVCLTAALMFSLVILSRILSCLAA